MVCCRAVALQCLQSPRDKLVADSEATSKSSSSPSLLSLSLLEIVNGDEGMMSLGRPRVSLGPVALLCGLGQLFGVIGEDLGE